MDHSTDSPRLDLDFTSRAGRSNGYWGLDKPKTDYWSWMDLFSPEECDSIIEIGKTSEMVLGEAGAKGLSNYRESRINFMYPNGYTDWIFHRLEHGAHELNRFLGFDLHGFGEGIQFTEYTAPGGHYDWHCDTGHWSHIRKMSITVELSDPSSFEGGQLELNATGHPTKIENIRGRATAFPSYTLHRVLPVTSGTRYSLVVWMTGPPFK